MFWCPKVTPVKSSLFQLCNFNKFRTHVYQILSLLKWLPIILTSPLDYPSTFLIGLPGYSKQVVIIKKKDSFATLIISMGKPSD